MPMENFVPISMNNLWILMLFGHFKLFFFFFTHNDKNNLNRKMLKILHNLLHKFTKNVFLIFFFFLKLSIVHI